MLYNTLYVPTWLIRYFDNLINPNENIAFSVSPLCIFLHVCNCPMVGLVINPVSGYHADTPITIKAEPSIWPTAAFINIHEHPI